MSGSSAHCGDGLKGQISGALGSPLVVLFEQQCADEADDGVIVGEDADDLGAPLDLAIEALDGVGNRYKNFGASIRLRF